MPHALTSRILDVLGRGRLLHVGGGNTDLLCELLLADCDAYAVWVGNGSSQAMPHPRCRQLLEVQSMAGSFETLVVEARPDTAPLVALQQLFHYTGMPRNLVLAARGHDRRKLENGLILLGWRRHPGVTTTSDPAASTDAVLGVIGFYQRTPQYAVAG